jgi:hypothetical protein
MEPAAIIRVFLMVGTFQNIGLTKHGPGSKAVD